jgi:hypothetical protein
MATTTRTNDHYIGLALLFFFNLLFTLLTPVHAGSVEVQACEAGGDGLRRCGPPKLVELSPAGDMDLEEFQDVSFILAEIEQTEALANTVHKNPLVLEAAGLFLYLADSRDLPDDYLEIMFKRLFPQPQWKWVPGVTIKRLRSRLYIMSISQAAVGTESSLYLFEGRACHKIDSGETGLIQLVEVKTAGPAITVKYVRTPGSSRPETVTATLTREGTAWKIIRVKSEE